jgi:transcriptional regulator with XRE-family HTH domain
MATRRKGMIDWLYLGNRIADMRRSRKMTQQELAEYIGRSEVYIGYMEQGKRHGTLETMIKIVNILGYSMDDLFSEYLDHKMPASYDIKLLVSSCKPEERDVIFRMIHDMLDFIRGKKQYADQEDSKTIQ